MVHAVPGRIRIYGFIPEELRRRVGASLLSAADIALFDFFCASSGMAEKPSVLPAYP
jgi:hypothetical protein